MAKKSRGEMTAAQKRAAKKTGDAESEEPQSGRRIVQVG